MSIYTLLEEWRNLGPSRWAENSYGWILEDGTPIKLAEWQRLILGEYWQRREDISTLFISAPKKAGKTALNSLLTCYRWLTRPGIHFGLGNDFDQGALLQADMIGEMCKRHPVLKRHTKVNKGEIVFLPTNSRLITLPADYAGSSGHNFLTVSFTEVWALTYESHLRLFEELTPPPLVGALRIVDSYAGWTGESVLLENIWTRAKLGKQIADSLYLTGQQLSFIAEGDSGHKATWRGTESQRQAYLTEQRETLRDGTFRRLHKNEWQTSEDAFIQPEQWDALITPGYTCPSPSKSVHLHAAVDIGVKRDWAAVASVIEDSEGLSLGPYRLWKPPKKGEVDLSAVEDYLIELDAGYSLSSLSGDPSQFLYMKQRLNAGGIRTEEFSQHPSQMTKAGNALFDSIRQGKLKVYAGSTDLRECVLNARGKETERGVRLVKQTQSKKIDAAIALAMAVALALEAPDVGTLEIGPNPMAGYRGGGEDDNLDYRRAYAQAYGIPEMLQ